MVRAKGGRGWIAVGAVGFLTVSIAAYGIVHKPIGSEQIQALFADARAMVAAFAIVVVAGGLGRRAFPHGQSAELARAVTDCALGLGLLSLAVLGLGVVGGLRPLILLALAGGIAIGLRRSIAEWWADLTVGLGEVSRAKGFPRVILLLSLAWLAIEFLEALAPPVHFDALVYHLALPAQFIEAGRLVFTPGNPFWGMPLGASMLYTWAMALGGESAAPLLGWAVGLLALLLVWTTARSISERAGAGAVAALLAGESLAASLGWAYADWFAALYAAAMLSLLSSRRIGQGTTSLAAGLAAGFAFGAKLTAAPAIAAGLAAIVLLVPSRKVSHALRFGFCAIATGIPWLVKNLVATGAPLFPFFGASPAVDPLRQALYRSAGEPFGLGLRLAAPVLASHVGREAGSGYSASIGPLLLGLLPGVLFLEARARHSLRPAAILWAFGSIAWSVEGLVSPLASQSRLHFWMFPAWAVLAGAGLAGWDGFRVGRVRLSQLASALVLLSLGLSLGDGVLSSVRANPAAAVLGLESPDAYRTRRLGAYGLAMQAVRELRSGSRVLMLWEARSLDCLPACAPDAWLDRWILDRRGLQSADRIASHWAEEGFTHVLVHRAGLEFVRRQSGGPYVEQDWQELDALFVRLIPVNEIGDGYTLFALPP